MVFPRPACLEKSALRDFLSTLRSACQHANNVHTYRWFSAFFNAAHNAMARQQDRPAWDKDVAKVIGTRRTGMMSLLLKRVAIVWKGVEEDCRTVGELALAGTPAAPSPEAVERFVQGIEKVHVRAVELMLDGVESVLRAMVKAVATCVARNPVETNLKAMKMIMQSALDSAKKPERDDDDDGVVADDATSDAEDVDPARHHRADVAAASAGLQRMELELSEKIHDDDAAGAAAADSGELGRETGDVVALPPAKDVFAETRLLLKSELEAVWGREALMARLLPAASVDVRARKFAEEFQRLLCLPEVALAPALHDSQSESDRASSALVEAALPLVLTEINACALGTGVFDKGQEVLLRWREVLKAPKVATSVAVMATVKQYRTEWLVFIREMQKGQFTLRTWNNMR